MLRGRRSLQWITRGHMKLEHTDMFAESREQCPRLTAAHRHWNPRNGRSSSEGTSLPSQHVKWYYRCRCASVVCVAFTWPSMLAMTCSAALAEKLVAHSKD
eukprot:2598754-Amphidinium_carterae.1